MLLLRRKIASPERMITMVDMPSSIGGTGSGGFLPPPPPPPWKKEMGAGAPADMFSRSGQSTGQTIPRVFSAPSGAAQGTGDTRSLASMSPDLPAGWEVETGSHNGTYFQVAHPVGWKLINAPTAALVVNPFDKNAVVSFMWFNGMGKTDPQTQIDSAIQFNNLQNYQVLNRTPVETIETPAGPHKIMEQDGTYDYRGERCRHHLTSMTSDNTDPYFLFWSGSMVWSQAPDGKWDKYSPILYQISSSFQIVPPPPPPSTGGYQIVPA